MSAAILVVDDDDAIRRMLVRTLAADGYEVGGAPDGGAALAAIERSAPDLVVLDVGLPDLDGFAVCRRLRAKGLALPVLMLTARDAVPDRVTGLDAGADDYLVKPFAFSELLARVRSVLRRGPKQTSENLKVGDLEIEPRRRRVFRGDKKIDLTAKEFALLDYLVRNTGEVLSRTLIAEQVWDMNFDSDTNVVDVAMRRLRAKVDDPFEVKLIRTVRGVGYVIEEPAS
jgi:two-component system, OmpR family, copper resistance phosphate regulon response regulator CusR